MLRNGNSTPVLTYSQGALRRLSVAGQDWQALPWHEDGQGNVYGGEFVDAAEDSYEFFESPDDAGHDV